MLNPIVKLLLFSSVVLIFVFPLARADIYDGGEYSTEKMEETDWGKPTDAAKDNFAYTEDRLSNAPLGKKLYVVGKDGACHYGNFFSTKFEHSLVVYTKTTVSADNCVYQKTFDKSPRGYSIVAHDGGVCVPSRGHVVAPENKDKKWIVQEDGSPVSFAKCVGETVAYGEQPGKLNVDEMLRMPASTAAMSEHIVFEKQVGPIEAVTQRADKIVQKADTTGAVTGGIITREVSHEEVHADSPFTVQLASYLSEDDAQAKIASLKALGVDAFESVAVVNSMRRYRVCSGQFASVKAAKQVLPNIKKSSGVTDAVIVKLKPTVVSDPTAQAFPIHHYELAVKSHSNIRMLASVDDESMRTEPKGKFTIQVASVPSEDEAVMKIGELKQKGLDAFKVAAWINGEKRFRVCSGHFASMKDAKSAQKEISSKSGEKAAFVQSLKTN